MAQPGITGALKIIMATFVFLHLTNNGGSNVAKVYYPVSSVAFLRSPNLLSTAYNSGGIASVRN